MWLDTNNGVPFYREIDFGGLLSKAGELKDKAKKGASEVLDSVGSFFGGLLGGDDEDKKDIQEQGKNVISLEEKRMQLKRSPKDALRDDQVRQQQAQEKILDNKPQTVVVQGGGRQGAVATSGMTVNKQISVEDTRLASANAGESFTPSPDALATNPEGVTEFSTG